MSRCRAGCRWKCPDGPEQMTWSRLARTSQQERGCSAIRPHHGPFRDTGVLPVKRLTLQRVVLHTELIPGFSLFSFLNRLLYLLQLISSLKRI